MFQINANVGNNNLNNSGEMNQISGNNYGNITGNNNSNNRVKIKKIK